LTVIFFSCTSKTKDSKNVNPNSETVIDTTLKIDNSSSIDRAEIIETKNQIGKNGLLTNLQGKWINTSLFDSTLVSKQLNPWLYDFYGDLILIINESDSASISGNMDGGIGIINLIDSISFSFPDRVDNPIFIYSIQKDLIFQNINSKNPIIYRRVEEKDRIEIIGNEEAFNKYFIDKFFSDYFSKKEKSKIVDIWNGFETYWPFDFDALALGKNRKAEYYAWKFDGDTLLLFETSHEYDADSGFPSYKIEKLKKKITKK